MRSTSRRSRGRRTQDHREGRLARTPEEQGFLRDVHAGLPAFRTVPRPARTRSTYDHIHVDRCGARAAPVCHPVAVPGDVVAVRAGFRFARGELEITWLIKQQLDGKPRFFGSCSGRDQAYEKPRARSRREKD